MNVVLEQATPNPVEFIAKIASICYDSNPKNAMELVKKLYKSGHHSVFEHVYFTFKIEGISRACANQITRHRLCSFTQRSQRYCDEGEFSYVTPKALEEPQAYEIFMRRVKSEYSIMRQEGIPAEDARMVLPNACCTSLYASMNLRELMHVCNLRLCKRAQWEIREVAKAMASLVDEKLQFLLVPTCQAPHLRCVLGCDKK